MSYFTCTACRTLLDEINHACVSFFPDPYSNEDSPLHYLVEPGDIILTVDGVDCRAKDAHTLAEWIARKPWVPEHILELREVTDRLTANRNLPSH